MGVAEPPTNIHRNWVVFILMETLTKNWMGTWMETLMDQCGGCGSVSQTNQQNIPLELVCHLDGNFDGNLDGNEELVIIDSVVSLITHYSAPVALSL
jgi:hypothetical protein